MEMPKSGGSYTRDPVTGALTRVESPAEEIAIAAVAVPPAPAAASAPSPEIPDAAASGDDTSSKKRAGK